MRKISAKVKEELLADPRMKKCARACEGNCGGRITWEHVIIYGGRQLDEAWAIIPLCEYHHDVNTYQDIGDLNKEKNLWIALKQAPPGRLKALSKAIDYEKRLDYLNKKYSSGP